MRATSAPYDEHERAPTIATAGRSRRPSSPRPRTNRPAGVSKIAPSALGKWGDAGPPAPGEREPLHGAGEQLVGFGVPSRNLGTKPLACPTHALSHRRGRFGGTCGQLETARTRDGDDEVESVEQRPRELVAKR